MSLVVNPLVAASLRLAVASLVVNPLAVPVNAGVMERINE